MAKPKIKTLKYPLWFNITFYILTIILPIVLVMIEGYKSPSQTFRWTFGIITGLIIIYTFVKKFILKYLEKVKSLGIINHDFNLGSYVALRFISPVNLGEIESREDKILLMALCCLFQKKVKKLNQIIKFIKGL